MAIDVVRGGVNNIAAANEVTSVISQLTNYTGTLYLGYPLASKSETVITVDAFGNKRKGCHSYYI